MYYVYGVTSCQNVLTSILKYGCHGNLTDHGYVWSLDYSSSRWSWKVCFVDVLWNIRFCATIDTRTETCNGAVRCSVWVPSVRIFSQPHSWLKLTVFKRIEMALSNLLVFSFITTSLYVVHEVQVTYNYLLSFNTAVVEANWQGQYLFVRGKLGLNSTYSYDLAIAGFLPGSGKGD